MLLQAGWLLVVCPGVSKLLKAVAADVWLGALLGWILDLPLAFPRFVTGIPLGARRRFVRFLLFFSFLLLFLYRIWSWNSFNGLHHGCRVKFRGYGGPGESTLVQICKDSGIVIPGPLPREVGEIRIS